MRRFRRLPTIAIVILAGAVLVPGAHAARVSGRISGGPPPVVDKTPDMYGKFRRGGQETTTAPHPLIVILEAAGGSPAGPAPSEHPIMDQRNERFSPRALPVRTGTTVDFLNSDNFYHNVFSLSSVRKFDLGRYRKGLSKSVTFSKPGLVKLFCDIHPNMIGYILVTDSPWFASMSPGGEYEIANVPPGSYTVRVWHERLNEPIDISTVSVGNAADVELDLSVPS